jgi:hypothetical protein
MATLLPKSAVIKLCCTAYFMTTTVALLTKEGPQKYKCCTRWHHFLQEACIGFKLYNIFHENPYSAHEAWLSFAINPRIAIPVFLLAFSAATLRVETLLAHIGFFLTAFFLLRDTGLSRTALSGLCCAWGWEWPRSPSRALWVTAVSELTVIARNNHDNECKEIGKWS